MKKPLVSIIVTIYNNQKYLEKCLSSLINQSFKDFEIIIIDDGSTDDSSIIYKRFSKQDKRIKVTYKFNEGVSAARNLGINKSLGEFLTFCDGDDYWEKNRLEKMYDSIKSNESDAAITGFKSIKRNEVFNIHFLNKEIFNLKTNIDKANFISHKLLTYLVGWEVWSWLFKSSIIKNNNIYFNKECNDYGEDMGFVLEYTLFCKKINTLNTIDYLHTMNPNSIMIKSNNIIRLNELNEVSYRFTSKLNAELLKYKSLFHILIISNQIEKAENLRIIKTIKDQIIYIKKKDYFIKEISHFNDNKLNYKNLLNAFTYYKLIYYAELILNNKYKILNKFKYYILKTVIKTSKKINKAFKISKN